MAEFQKNKNTDHNIWHSPIVLFIILIIVLVFMYKMIDLIEKTKETSRKKEFVADQVSKLKEREIVLEENILRLNTDTGIEEEIREKYQLVKEGEKMVVIVDREVEGNDGEIEEKSQNSFIRFFQNLFD